MRSRRDHTKIESDSDGVQEISINMEHRCNTTVTWEFTVVAHVASAGTWLFHQLVRS